MKFKKLTALLLSASMVVGLLAGCGNSSSNNGGSTNTSDPGSEQTGEVSNASGESSLKGKRVRVVIGSTSTGGDSYMIADMVTRYLGEEMGFNGKVDAVGNAQALDAVSKADGDGTTIMMFHDMAYLSVLFGAVGEEYALENLTVGPRIGVNPGGCFAANASVPYNSLAEAAQWLADNPGETLRVNIESGSASHLCFVVWYMWAKETYGDDVASRIKALVGGTTDEKKQRLWDGNAGITFNGEPFDFNKDFFMLFPKDMDEGVLNEITAAMQKVCENPDFQAEMANLMYSHVTAEEADLEASREYINAKRETSNAIVEVAPGLDELT